MNKTANTTGVMYSQPWNLGMQNGLQFMNHAYDSVGRVYAAQLLNGANESVLHDYRGDFSDMQKGLLQHMIQTTNTQAFDRALHACVQHNVMSSGAAALFCKHTQKETNYVLPQSPQVTLQEQVYSMPSPPHMSDHVQPYNLPSPPHMSDHVQPYNLPSPPHMSDHEQPFDVPSPPSLSAVKTEPADTHETHDMPSSMAVDQQNLQENPLEDSSTKLPVLQEQDINDMSKDAPVLQEKPKSAKKTRLSLNARRGRTETNLTLKPNKRQKS